MLVQGIRKVCSQSGNKAILKNFHSGTEERNGAIGRAQVGRFAGFSQENNDGALPDGRDNAVEKGKVESRSKEIDP